LSVRVIFRQASREKFYREQSRTKLLDKGQMCCTHLRQNE